MVCGPRPDNYADVLLLQSERCCVICIYELALDSNGFSTFSYLRVYKYNAEV